MRVAVLMRITLGVLLLLCGVASSAPRMYRYRYYYSSLLAGPPTERLAMFTLVLDRDKATLTVERSHVEHDKADDWVFEPAVVYTGLAADTTHRGLHLELETEDGKQQIVTTCEATTLRVGGANALLVPSKNNSECNTDLEWSPRVTTKVPVLVCRFGSASGDDDPVIPEDAYLAAAPGIEAIAVNEDCAMQGTAFRRMKSPAVLTPSREKRWLPVRGTPRHGA